MERLDRIHAHQIKVEMAREAQGHAEYMATLKAGDSLDSRATWQSLGALGVVLLGGLLLFERGFTEGATIVLQVGLGFAGGSLVQRTVRSLPTRPRLPSTPEAAEKSE